MTRLTVQQYADELGVNISTVYNSLGEEKFNFRQRERNRSFTYPRAYLEDKRRRHVAKGERGLSASFPDGLKRLDNVGLRGYSVSSEGKIYDRILGKEVSTYVDDSGYRIARLDRINERWRVHRLVLTGFDGAPRNRSIQADHINGDKLDNRIANLEWVSARENNRRQKRRLYPHPNAPKNYTEKELALMRGGFIRGLTFTEFMKYNKSMDGRISGSTYRRRKKDFLDGMVIPDWDDIAFERRLALAVGCFHSSHPEFIIENAKRYGFEWSGEEPTIGEMVLFRRWAHNTKWLNRFQDDVGWNREDEVRKTRFWPQFRSAIYQYWHRNKYDQFRPIDRKSKLLIMLLKGENPYAEFEGEADELDPEDCALEAHYNLESSA